MGEFHSIRTIRLQGEHHLYKPTDSEPLTLNSCALLVVTDFANRQPQVISKDVDIDHALYMMKNGHVRSKIVVDYDDAFLGVVNSRDLTGRKVLSIAQRRGQPRSELTVEHVMTRKEDLHAIPYQSVEKSTIGDVLETMQQLGQHHILLTDEQSRLRGMISASDIARALHVPVSIFQKLSSFKDILEVMCGREDLTA
ncbi:CBS domain-containing protein (plasmid) [Pseudoalteromonas sp. T1lg65]|uniref:CBS domain-containing protein n=1 Tax=Pseudoalteromonas sp. T1lg65 TaxID=2077101 RepID=UPI003F790371